MKKPKEGNSRGAGERSVGGQLACPGFLVQNSPLLTRDVCGALATVLTKVTLQILEYKGYGVPSPES